MTKIDKKIPGSQNEKEKNKYCQYITLYSFGLQIRAVYTASDRVFTIQTVQRLNSYGKR